MVEETGTGLVVETSRLRIFWDNEEMLGMSLPKNERPENSEELGEVLRDIADFLKPVLDATEGELEKLGFVKKDDE